MNDHTEMIAHSRKDVIYNNLKEIARNPQGFVNEEMATVARGTLDLIDAYESRIDNLGKMLKFHQLNPMNAGSSTQIDELELLNLREDNRCLKMKQATLDSELDLLSQDAESYRKEVEHLRGRLLAAYEQIDILNERKQELERTIISQAIELGYVRGLMKSESNINRMERAKENRNHVEL